MLIFNKRILENNKHSFDYVISLNYDQRQKSRLKITLNSSEEAAINLKRGEKLASGDLLTSTVGKILKIKSKKENLIHVEFKDIKIMSLIAYHIGNRHVPLEFGNTFLRLNYDHVLEKMINNLGGKVSKIVDEFNPVGGAYNQNHTLPTDSKNSKIHYF